MKRKEYSLIIILFISVIKFYQIFISPALGNRCRFYPSCSEYLIESLKYKGVIKGLIAGVMRILRCNPFNSGGYDPVENGARRHARD